MKMTRFGAAARALARMAAGLLIVVGWPGRAEAQTGTRAEVGIEAAALLGEAAASNTFGDACFMDATPYLAPDLGVSVYALEYARHDTGTTVTVIASARRDDCPVIMMWQGAPRHKDPRTLAAAREKIKAQFGVDAGSPSRLFWLDTHELWAEFPERIPKTGRPILCNLYTAEIADIQDLAPKWKNRLANTAFTQASRELKADLASAGATNDPVIMEAQAAAGRADHVDALWKDADAWLAGEGAKKLVTGGRAVNRTPASANGIAVIFPNASGIALQRMKDYRIRWSVSGSVGSAVKIQLYKGDSAVKTIASSVPASDGGYTWWVPRDLSLGGDYRIGISSTSHSSINDRSDNAFTIAAYSGPPSHKEHYIGGVPNINQEDVPDCGVVSSMDVILYWDRHGYHRLVDGSDLQTLRTTLRQAMHYDAGTYSQNEADGIREYCNDAAYRRQYSFQVSGPQYVSMASDPFPTLVKEIHDGHPVRIVVRNYTDDPNNPTDKGYVDADGAGSHAMCVVGYVQNTLFAGHAGNRWVIVHDNHNRGGHFPDADVIDDEPYLDWDRATNCIITVKPGPSSNPVVTYPSPGSLSGAIVWKTGQSQEITWRNFKGSSVRIELYKGSTRNRTIASSTANDGSFTSAVPGGQACGPDYRVRIASPGDSASDDSDACFSIVPAIMPLAANAAATAARISPAGAADWYRFAVPATGLYTIETWPGTLLDNYMYLYGPDDQAKLIEQDDDDGAGNAAKIGPRSLAPGTYYVKVKPFYSSGAGTYSIQVRSVTAAQGQRTAAHRRLVDDRR